jgi:hypothetical protein
MEPIYITEGELEYFTNVPLIACEATIPLKPQMSFEEEAKDCITLEEFGKRWKENIRKYIHNT